MDTGGLHLAESLPAPKAAALMYLTIIDNNGAGLLIVQN